MRPPPKIKAAPGTKIEAAKKKSMNLDDSPELSALQSPRLLPEMCPKFLTCNAPVCVLDSDWHKRSSHNEDATCFYLTESVKDGAETHFQVAGLGELYQQILRVRPYIIQRHSRIARKLEAAKQSGSRMARKFGGREASLYTRIGE